MHGRFRTQRAGMSLIELLIVLSIISLLLQLVVPAVQHARESARRATCANSLRQIALACQSYEVSTKKFPPGFILKPRHNYVQYILPYIEEQAIYDKYDFKSDWNAGANIETTKSDILLLHCPTAPREYPYISDYAVCTKLNDELKVALVKEKLVRDRTDTTGILRGKPIEPAKITDGLSHTILMCETSGRPDRYVLGQLKRSNTITGARWATPAARFEIDYRCDGSKLGKGSQLINCTSKNEVYSFHEEGANFAYGDGSVKLVAKDVDPDVFVSDLTASAGD